MGNLYLFSFPIASSQHPRADILARMSLTCHKEIGRVRRVYGVGRGCYEDAASKLLPWNSSFTKSVTISVAA